MFKFIKRMLLVAALMVPWVTQAQCVGTECSITIDGTDSFGDGWNGASISVYQGTTLKGTFTLNDGATSSATVTVCTDDSVRFVWNEGSYDGECGFTILNGDGSTIIANAAGDDYTDGDVITVAEVICPTCPAPSNLTLAVLNSDSLFVTWTAHGDETEWLVYVNGVYEGSASDESYLISDPVEGSLYNITVAAFCGVGDTSIFIGPLSVTIPGAAITQYPYFTGFETGDDNGWSFENDATNKWFIGTATSHNDSSSLYISNNSGTSNAYNTGGTQFSYAYRAFEVDDDNVFTFKFDWKANGESNYDYLRAWVAPATAQFTAAHDPQGGTSAYNYQTTTPSGWIDLGGKMNGTSNWNTVRTPVTLTAGTYYLVFMWANDASGGSQPPAAVDNVGISVLNCSAVENLQAVATIGSALISWQAGPAGDYSGATVRYKVDTASTWTEVTTSETSLVLTGLDAGMNYDVRVVANCLSGDSGDFVATTFATGNFVCLELDPATADTVFFTNASSGISGCLANSAWGNTAYQTIYTAAELTAAGLQPGPITGIDLGFTASSSYAKEFTIFLGNSSTTSISNATLEDPNAHTLVYGPAPHPTNTSGWQHYEFDQDFTWDGVSSIIMTTFMNQPQGQSQSSSSGLTGYYVSASNKARYRYKDSAPFTLSDYNSGNSGTTYSYRASIHFYTGECQTMATCAAPAASITHVDTTNVTLAWVPGANETSWEVWYRQGNSGAYTVASDNVTTTDYTLSELQPGTEYSFMVVNICSPDTFYSSVLSCFTDCAPIDGMFDDFNSYATGAGAQLNPCWHKGVYGTTTQYPYVTTWNSANCLYFYGYVSGSTNYYSWLVLPEMRDSVNAYEMEFNMRKYSTSTYYPTVLMIGVVTDPNDISTFDTLATMEATVYGQWEDFYYSFEDYHGDGRYITLLAPSYLAPGETYSYNYVYLDNLFVGRRSSCAKPTRFHARDIDATSAVLAWDSIEDYMNVKVLYNTVNNINTATEVTTTDASVLINGLSATTTYYCWLTAYCAEDSSRTVTCTFTTTAACNPVVNLTVTEATSSIASITWQSDPVTPASGYTFEWKVADSATWNTVTTTNTYYQLVGLTEGTTYQVRVTAACDNDTANAATISFTTTTPGTIGSNEGTYYLPTYPYYEYSISEQMWTAGELAEYGDTINGIYFNAASAIAGRVMQMWVVDTTLDDLSTSNYVPSTAMTLVMDDTIDIVTGWNYFPFDQPYVRDLSKNLVVLTYDHTGSYETFSGFIATTSAVNSLYSYQDGDPYSTTDLSDLTAEGVRAQMQLNATMVQPTCLAPHPVIAEATDNSISLVWVAGLNETSWSVDYRGLTDTNWTSVTGSTTNTNITINNLDPSTSYVIRVGALCGSDTMYAAVRGTTACGAFSAPYVEDFNVYSSGEYDFDPCWYKGNTVNSNMPYIVNITGQGPCMLMPQGSYVILPQVGSDVSAMQVRMQYVVAQTNIYAYVGVCSHPEDILSMTIIDTLWASAAGVAEWFTIPLDRYGNADGYVAIYSPFNQTYYDNINVEMIPQCGTVDSIAATNITTTTADITWQAGANASSYIVEYGPLGSNNYTTIPASGLTVSLSNLLHSTTYDVNIYTACPTMNDTSIAANFKFQTGCDTVSLPYFEDFDHCNAPALTMTGILPNCWNFMFTAANTSYTSTVPQLYSSTSYANSGQYSLYTYGQAIITLPQMPVDVNQLQLSLHDHFTSTGYYGLIIGVCDSNWGNYEQSFVPIDTIYGETANVDFTTYRLAEYTGTGRYIAFKNFYYYSNYNYAYGYNYIDDISIDYLPSCLPVINLHSNGNTSTSISIDWTDLVTSTEWEVSYSTTPLTDPSLGTTAIVNSHPYNVTGLTAGTNYYFYVRNICGVGDTSIWAGFGPSAPGQWIMRPGIDTLYMCGGVIYDDGGPNGQYSDNQNNTIILMPSVPSSLVSVSGWTADESSFDYLNIYDGIGTTGTLLYSSNVSGSYAGTFTDLTSTTGPLTLLFHSDGSVHSYAGFEVNVSCISVSCMVTGLGLNPNEPQNSTELSLVWDDINAMKYQVAYGAPGFDIDAATTTITETTDTHYTITGLSATTNYEVYVRGICSGADTGSWAHNIFQTAMCDNVVVAQNFLDSVAGTTSTYSPMGYTTYNYSYVQTIIDSADLAEISGEISAFAFHPSTTNKGDYFTHMTIYMANIPDSLSVANSFIHPSADVVFDTVISDRDMCYTTTDWQLHGFDHPFTWDGHSNILISVQRNHGSWSSGGTFHAHTHPAGKGRYVYQDSGPYDPSTVSGGTAITAVGDIRLFSCGTACAKPRVLPVSDLSYNTATLNWSSTATDFEVSVKAATEGTWPAEVAVSNATSYVANNLQPATPYQYRVRAICDATESLISDWAMGEFVTDSLPCFAPSDLQATELDVTSATLAWTAGGAETQWSIHVWNSGFNEEYTATSNPFTVTGLTQTTTYSAAIKSLCGDGNVESEYSDTIQFTTATCGEVTGVIVNEVTANTAKVSWNAGTASSYEVEYGEYGYGAGQGHTEIVQGTTYNITGLESETQYSVRVRAVCEATAMGPWTDPVNFTTGTEGINVADGMNVSIYPNPTSSNTTIALSGVNGDVTITIVDMNGRVVMSDSMSCEGDCVKTMEVSGLAQGAYFVRVNGENVNMVKKLVVK